ncbi:NnrS family protein [Mangrovimicrobium sediminis]|uniref:NnrS family protein n=1 Tax=Mangrovimicrobium sediminis TaxID=2562682 RepID=A0A4Z0LYH1_9GAMM|nr:NnrS family protein [Haliea sp. SAOS-164]TGD72135.1 NnrS family protein [Haliea sp. SAOS-164]
MTAGSGITQPFSYPFRIFFLSCAAWAVLLVALWVLYVNGTGALAPAYPGNLWHRHEMLFGLLGPALAGFLLTAVCVWTRTQRLHGWLLAALWLVWFAARLVTSWGGVDSAPLATALNLAFLPLVGLDALWRVVRARQWRQLPILVVVFALWLVQGAMLLGDSAQAFDVGLVLAAALMLIVGGRITPAFSANWLRLQGADADQVRLSPALDVALLAALAVLSLGLFAGWLVLVSGGALVAAALALWRQVRWRGWLTRAEPLLWILHLSLLWIPLALLLLAGRDLLDLPPTAWQHALGIGAMASLILGVMSRVSLGHTGRPLQLPQGMTAAFWLIQASAVLRLATVFGALPWRWGIMGAGLAWVLAFALFLWRYSAILCQPRVDNQPG